VSVIAKPAPTIRPLSRWDKCEKLTRKLFVAAMIAAAIAYAIYEKTQPEPIIVNSSMSAPASPGDWKVTAEEDDTDWKTDHRFFILWAVSFSVCAVVALFPMFSLKCFGWAVLGGIGFALREAFGTVVVVAVLGLAFGLWAIWNMVVHLFLVQQEDLRAIVREELAASRIKAIGDDVA
jgi:uncharacterized membrane protein